MSQNTQSTRKCMAIFFILLTYFWYRALAHGIGHLVGSIEVGKMADLVVYTPQFFGTKPELILKAGVVVWGNIGK